MGAKFESMTAAFKQACTTLQRENQEFYRQLLIDMHIFQMNMFPTVVTTCQQNTINSVTNYQANSPTLDALDTTPSGLDIPPTSTVHSNDPKLATNALDTAPSCLDIPSTSTAHSDAVLPPNRIEPLRTEPSSGFGSTGIKSVRFDDNPNHEIQDRFDLAVRDLRFDSIRFEYSRLEPNQLSNRFDSVDSVYYSMSLYSPMAMSYPTICNGFSCF
jgi:hypothetical protein